ncbi:MAG: hypothetical protein GW855_03230 [Erythrobacter sp.]|nr:hypothetical protein [Erythrobacter sp.]NCQ63618.1 hypothetical protein [Alphaproteobacteria bacterium]
MRILATSIAFLAACSPIPAEEQSSDHAQERQDSSYATQAAAPAPDYAKLTRAERLEGEGYARREASAPLPANAREIGQAWFDRLEAAHALLGAGYDGKGPDGAITQIDVGMTQSDFARWARDNGWNVPKHIAWGVAPAMNLPAVSDSAKPGIRFWPASSARTGAQNEALIYGKVELRDGCFWATHGDGEADKLAFFHGEIGLDRDEEGFYILKDRVGGQTLARLGEPMNWGGPPSAYIAPETAKALHEACGDAPVLVVGSPESRERFATIYPHVRDQEAPPPPPTD